MSDQIQDRRAKLARLRELGVDPYGSRFTGVTPNRDIRALADRVPIEAGQTLDTPEARFRAAGRVALFRDTGKLIFMTVRDRTGELQWALSKKAIEEGTEASARGGHEGTEGREEGTEASARGGHEGTEGGEQGTGNREQGIGRSENAGAAYTRSTGREGAEGASPAHLFTSSPAHPLTPSPAHLLTSPPAHSATPSPAHAFTPPPPHDALGNTPGEAEWPVGPLAWQAAKMLDLGDIVGAEGRLGRTKTGELTLWVSRFRPLSKCLRPPPEKRLGLTDVEARYRKRYVDLFANPASRDVFITRARIIDYIRGVLRERHFVEVDTPVLQPIYGGAAARPFTTHHNTLDMQLYLRISPELYLKRCLVGGLERVYEFSRCFRNEGISPRHNPEFTMLELYQAYGDYHDMMDITEAIIAGAARDVIGTYKIAFEGREIDYTPPWPRRRYGDLVREHAGVDISDEAAVLKKASELGILAKLRKAESDRPPSQGGPQGGDATEMRGGSESSDASPSPYPLPRREASGDRPPFQGGPQGGEAVGARGGSESSDASPSPYPLPRREGAEEAPVDHAVLVNAIFEACVEQHLINPTFVIDYPAPLCPLTKRHPDDPNLALRFEAYVNGMEMGNAYSELNDPDVQRANLAGQVEGEGDETMRVMDDDFVEALEYAMPPAGGLGLGIDRLCMLLTGSPSIREVLLFPLQRAEQR